MPDDENLLNEMLKRIDGLMDQFKRESKKKPTQKLPENIHEQLDQLEQQVMLFRDMNEQIFRDAGTTIQDEIVRAEKSPEKTDPKQRKLFRRVGQTKQQLDEVKMQLDILVETRRAQQKNAQSPEDQKGKEIRERKKKFGRIGGRKHWKPL